MYTCQTPLVKVTFLYNEIASAITSLCATYLQVHHAVYNQLGFLILEQILPSTYPKWITIL